MPKPPVERGYHHGDARNALIAAARDLLEREGAAGLSLRQVADHAGLSRQAPYNHFADKEALLATLATGGFEALEAAMRAATAALTGHAALVAVARAYLDFARERPAMFRLMFTRSIVDLAKFPPAAAAARAAFDTLAAVIAALAPADKIDDLALAAWCLVHGYATLSNEAVVADADRGAGRARLFADIIVDSARPHAR